NIVPRKPVLGVRLVPEDCWKACSIMSPSSELSFRFPQPNADGGSAVMVQYWPTDGSPAMTRFRYAGQLPLYRTMTARSLFRPAQSLPLHVSVRQYPIFELFGP